MSTTQEWKYYNFDDHWDEFLKVWKSENVQRKLDSEMHMWMKKYPTIVYRRSEILEERTYVPSHVSRTTVYLDGRVEHTSHVHGKHIESHTKYDPYTDKKFRMYTRGDPLWKFGKDYGYYWYQKIHEDDEDFAMNRNSFVRSMANVHPGFIVRGNKMRSTRKDLDEFFMDNPVHDEYCDRQREKNAPKPDTLESMILIGGKEYLIKPLFHAADMLFDEEVLIIQDVDGKDQIVIPGKKIVFDLFNFYHITRDNDRSRQLDDDYYYKNPSFNLQSDEYYDSKIVDVDVDDYYYFTDDDSQTESLREWERDSMEVNGEWTDNSDWSD